MKREKQVIPFKSDNAVTLLELEEPTQVIFQILPLLMNISILVRVLNYTEVSQSTNWAT